MPWKETCPMDQRVQLIADSLSGSDSKKDLGMHDGMSRPTGDKWIERDRPPGPEGLPDRSRRPHRPPATTAPEIAERIVPRKLDHQRVGPKKAMARLRALDPEPPGPRLPPRGPATPWRPIDAARVHPARL